MSVEILKNFTSRENIPSRLFTEQGKEAWIHQQERLAAKARELFLIISKEEPHLSKLYNTNTTDPLIQNALWCLLENKHIEITPENILRTL